MRNPTKKRAGDGNINVCMPTSSRLLNRVRSSLCSRFKGRTCTKLTNILESYLLVSDLD
jgi:hypothetical protein